MKLLVFLLLPLWLGSCGVEGPTVPINLTVPNAPGEWVLVPPNAGGMGLGAFYVMKYEAKAWHDVNADGVVDSGEVNSLGLSVETETAIPLSIADNQPWRMINANESFAECESLGENYSLISNPEWLAIAREIENIASNWTAGSVGSGCLFRGNSGDIDCGYI
jgi:hypothetical protein